MYTPMFSALFRADPFGMNSLFSPTNLGYSTDGQPLLKAFAARGSNLVRYRLPEGQPWVLDLAYSFGEVPSPNSNNARLYGGTVGWNQKPWFLTYSFQKSVEGSAAAPVAAPATSQYQALSASWEALDGLRLTGNYVINRVDRAGTPKAKLAQLGAEVITIGCNPDGLNINQDVGATHPDALVRSVRSNGADLGVALDGDADRLQLVDAKGRLYNGDELLYLMAMDRLRRGKKVPGVVGTLMTNLAVEAALQKQGVELVRAKVGDRYVLEELQRRNWVLGGESSGHLLALDKHTTGDGLVSALQVLQACVSRNQSVAEQLDGVSLCPQVLLNVRLQPGQDWRGNTQLAELERSITADFAGQGRVLIRPSGTEPLLRVMVEAFDAARASRCAEQLAEVARQS